MLLRLCMFGLSMDEIESRRADSNRLPLLQLRVITQALQGCAGGCKHRIFRGVSFPCLAACCTVLRSRWYQDERQLQSDDGSHGTPSHPCAVTLQKASACACRFHATVAATRRLWHR